MTEHLGEFEQLLLFALLRLGDEAYGVPIRQEVEKRTGRSVAAGAVYTALSRLEDRGLVSSRLGRATPARGGRPKRHYRLEPAGVHALSRAYDDVQQMARGLVPKLTRLIAEEEPS